MVQCYIRVSGDSSIGACWHCNTCMIIECEWFSFLSSHSWRWLMLIWKLLLVAIWIKRGIIDKLRILGCCAWYWIIVSFWRRTIYRRRLRPHRLLAKLLCQYYMIGMLIYWRRNSLWATSSLKSLHWFSLPRNLLLLLTRVIAWTLWWRCSGVCYFRGWFYWTFKLFFWLSNFVKKYRLIPF